MKGLMKLVTIIFVIALLLGVLALDGENLAAAYSMAIGGLAGTFLISKFYWKLF